MANSGPGLGAFRRLVINSDKIADIETDIKRLFDTTSFVQGYKSLKRDIKKGAKENTLVIDLSGEGADSVSKKIRDIAVKFKAEVKIKNEKPMGGIKETEDKFSRFTMKVDQKGDFPYKGTIKRSEKGWQLYDEKGRPEETSPYQNIKSLMDYYNIKKEELTGPYTQNLQENKQIKMNKDLLRKLIKEQIKEVEKEEQAGEVETASETAKPRKLEKDEIGKFYVVTQPAKAKDNCVHELTMLEYANKIKSGELDESRIMGVYSSRGHANSHSKDLLSEIDKELDELKDYMTEFRKNKTEADAKKKNALNIINKYKK